MSAFSQNRKLLSQGFTLIEVVIVLIVLGILAAVAIPKYVDLRTDALNTAKLNTVAAVKSAYALAVYKQKGNPTLTQLVSYVDGGAIASGAPANNGVQVTIDGTNYVVQTYKTAGSNPDCTGPGSAITSLAADVVVCIGSITP